MGATTSHLRGSPSGELPPPPPRACFGRDELIERVVGLAENLTPLALIGVGGIGKTSIALTVLHHDRVKERFGDNRRFIRCDQINASRTSFLNQLSKVIGAGIENPDSLTPLQPFLSSTGIIIVLDNAESILDPQGTHAPEIYTIVEELSQFSNICLCLTSRIFTVPPDCKIFDIPTLSMDAACSTFYHIYSRKQSDLVNSILEQLDFHPLSIALLATVACHNQWDTNRLIEEWERQRTDVLCMQYNKSLAATIELSLASPMFQGLGPDAYNILGVVAFFPQGVDENNIDWLFPTTINRRDIFDKFCILSLAYRSNGFITMLAPLRDHICPKDPMSSQLLGMVKGHYFSRLSVDVTPGKPGYDGTKWIVLEDVNIEYLLDVFTSLDTTSVSVWDNCSCFMEHLYWHKKRPVTLGAKIEGLPDNHPSKPRCLFYLSRLFGSVGNNAEYKRLLVHTLKLWREQGNCLQVAQVLGFISGANRLLGLHKEGIQQAKEALEIHKQFNDLLGQAQSWQQLAQLLHGDGQLDAAEEAASQAINLLDGKDEQFLVCQSHRLLGLIYHSKGETEKAIGHFKAALGIASSFSWHDEQFWNHYCLARLFSKQGKIDDALTHVEHAKLHTSNGPYLLGRITWLHAKMLYKECRLEGAKSEALHAVGMFEKLGAAKDVIACRELLSNIEMKKKKSGDSSRLDCSGECWNSATSHVC